MAMEYPVPDRTLWAPLPDGEYELEFWGRPRRIMVRRKVEVFADLGALEGTSLLPDHLMDEMARKLTLQVRQDPEKTGHPAPTDQPDLAKPWFVSRDGIRVSEYLESEDAAWVWVLKHQGMSVDWALRYSGYSIDRRVSGE